MEFPVPIKIEEDRKIIIDLDDGISPEDIVVDWHLEMRRFFDSNSAISGENELVNVMKEYIKSLSQRAIHFEDIETLKVMVEKHTEHIYWLYRDLDLCFSDTYLDYMEHIMTFYLNLTLRTLLALKRKVKVTQKIVMGMTAKVVNRISCFLLSSEYHIFHVLIRQATTSVDDVVKDVLNILHSNICKQLFKNLYMHFLVLTPIRDTSDEAFCRGYILFENWKAFEDNKQNEKIEQLMKNIFGRGSECIKDNKFLSDLLKPQTSVISELMKVVGCDPSITKAYFDFIKSRQKPELEILEDIEKLAVEDRGYQEDDEDDDDEYNNLYDKMVGNECKNKLFTKIQNNMEIKEEKESKIPIAEDENEIIYLDSDSDSDIEIVSIKPSSSCGKAINIPQKLYIQTLKSSSKSKPPQTSFLDSISIDTDTTEFKRSSRKEKNLRPNPLSQLFSNARRTEIEAITISEPEVNKNPQQKQPIENSCNPSGKEDARIDGNSPHSEAVAPSDSSSVEQSACSRLLTETCSVSQELQSSSTITVQAATDKCLISDAVESSKITKDCYLSQDTDSSNTPGLQNESSVETTINKHLQNECLKMEEHNCKPVVNRSEATGLGNCLHPSNSKTDEIATSNHSPNEALRVLDGTRKTQIQKNANSICNLQTETSKAQEISLTSNQVDTQPKTSQIVEISFESQVRRNDIPVSEHMSSASVSGSECVYTGSRSGASETTEERTSVKVSETVICNSHLETDEDASCSKNKRSSQINGDTCDPIKKSVSTSLPNNSNASSIKDMRMVKNHKDYVENLDHYCSINNEVDLNISQVEQQKLDTETQLRLSNDSSQPCKNFEPDTFGEYATTETISSRLEESTKEINCPSDKQIDHQSEEKRNHLSDEEIIAQLDKQINFCLKVSTVCEISNTIEQKDLDAQTNGANESLKSQNKGFSSPNKPPCIDSHKSADAYGKFTRCNGSQFLKELEKNNQPLRKVELKLPKRRNSESSVFEFLSASRCSSSCEEDILRDNSDFKVTGNVERRFQENHPSNRRGNGQSGNSMFLDTGQCVGSKPLDTGQAIEEQRSPPTADLREQRTDDRANQNNSKTAQHKCSDKRTKSQSGKEELCGYPTPPGSEEDVDDTQPDPVYSNIFPTQTCSEQDDCYSDDRTVFRLNSADKLRATADATAPLTGQAVAQTCPTAARTDASVSIEVPEIVYNEQTMSENDFLTEEIDPSDPLVSLEEAELLERLSDEEKIDEDVSSDKTTTKSFAQISKTKVDGHDCEANSKQKRSANESDASRKVVIAPTPIKQQLPLSPEQLDSFDEMADSLENCTDQYDSNDFLSLPLKNRKRNATDALPESSPLPNKHSPIKRLKKSRKMESRIIPANTFDEFEAELWNRQSPIGNFAYEYDSSSCDSEVTTGLETRLSDGRTSRTGKPTASVKPSPLPPSTHIRQNGSTTSLLPLSGSTSTPKQPPLKGILKRVEHNHSYHPLHPVDDDWGSSFVYVHLEPDPALERGKRKTVGSRVKVSRKSLTACKVSKNHSRLFGRYSRVTLDHVWKNTNLDWEKISDPSKRLLWEMMPQRLYRIDYDKSTPHSLNCQIYFIEQPVTDESSTILNTRNPNLEIGSGSERYLLSESWAKYSNKRTDDVQSNSSVDVGTPKKGRKRKNDPNQTKPGTQRKRTEETPSQDETYPSASLGRALSMSLDFYRRQQDEAESELSSSKARRTGLIIKRFEKAIRLHNAGKPVDIDDLPVPLAFLRPSEDAAPANHTSAQVYRSPLPFSDTKHTPTARVQAHRRTVVWSSPEAVEAGRRKHSYDSMNVQAIGHS